MSARSVLSCGAVSVGASSTAVLGANVGRRSLTIVNDSANVVYLALTTSFGTAPSAVANSGVRLNANGGSFTLDGYAGAVVAIAASTSVITVLEV